MKLEAIQDMWSVDCRVDASDLAHEALRVAEVHNVYLKVYTAEKLLLKKMELDLKTLRLALFEFYTGGVTEETRAKGWVLPARGCVLKADSNQYIEAYPSYQAQVLKNELQSEKVAYVFEVVKSLNNRNFHITNAIKDRAWKQGN